MSQILGNAQKTCENILTHLDRISIQILPLIEREKLKQQVTSIHDRLLESNKKIMMRTRKGKQLAQQTKVDLEELERITETLSKQSRHQHDPEQKSKISETLTRVENDVDKMVTFWKSYEMVIT